jgi:hypothetical protein
MVGPPHRSQSSFPRTLLRDCITSGKASISTELRKAEKSWPANPECGFPGMASPPFTGAAKKYEVALEQAGAGAGPRTVSSSRLAAEPGSAYGRV